MGLELRDDKEPKGEKAKGSIGKALESERGEFLTQVLVHDRQTRVEGGKSQRKSFKKF